ncbi:hypothetical protein C8R46DRAFT_1354363, partial [Mycena filopes]
MRFNISTFLLTVYASIQVVQADWHCNCQTNGIIDVPSTDDCCQAVLGGFIGVVCLVSDKEMATFQTCCVVFQREGDTCIPL